MADKNSKGKTLIKQFFRHPIKTLSVVNMYNIRLFVSTAHYSGLKAAIQTTRNVINNSMDDYRRSENREQYLTTIKNIPQTLEIPCFPEPLVSIIIPVYNQLDFTLACIESVIRNTDNVPYEVILGDDNSNDGTATIDQRVKNLQIVRNEQNLGFLLNCNNAAKYARGKYLLFLNNDTVVKENWLLPMVELIESSDKVGAVGSKLIYPDGLCQEAGGIIWSDGTARNYGKGDNPNAPEYNYVKEVDYISAASLLVRKDIFDEIGGFDPLFVPAYCEDSDLCLSIRKLGFSVLYQPLSEVIHFEGITHGKSISKRINPYQEANIQKLNEKWSSYLLKNNAPAGTDLMHARDRSYGKRTVLFITHHLPSNDLDAENRQMYGYLVKLAENGYNVKLASRDFHYDPTYMIPLQQKGIEVLYGAEYIENWKSLAKKNWKKYDHIVLVGYRCADEFLEYLGHHTKARIDYLQFSNPVTALEREYDLFHDSHTLVTLALVKRRNPKLMETADNCITVSCKDG